MYGLCSKMHFPLSVFYTEHHNKKCSRFSFSSQKEHLLLFMSEKTLFNNLRRSCLAFIINAAPIVLSNHNKNTHFLIGATLLSEN